MKNVRTLLIKKEGLQLFLCSLFCILVGLVIGFIALLIIEPSGAVEAILTILKNFFKYPKAQVAFKYFGSTLLKASPLLMCSLSVLFSYKTGLFNIGVAGQYTIGTAVALFLGLYFKLPWYVCILGVVIFASLWGMLIGILKIYCNVNEVISGIMLNWIALYLTNMLLSIVKDSASNHTLSLEKVNKSALMPSMGLQTLFSNPYVSVSIPMAILVAIAVWIIMEKTKLGFELKATGLNKDAAKYSGMAERKNLLMTLAISGAIAGAGGAFYYLSGYEYWIVTSSAVPAMGFNGIAAAFLGGLNPIGAIFASYFIQHITDSGAYIDRGLYCSQISDLISAIIIYSCGFVGFLKMFLVNRIQKNIKKEGGNS